MCWLYKFCKPKRNNRELKQIIFDAGKVRERNFKLISFNFYSNT